METALKILVVDDESGILLMCQQLLELSSYEVLTATEAEQALAIAAEQKIDLLLTDIRLPAMDGFTLIQRIKAIQPEIAVVVMTGYNTVETAIKALRSGVDGLLIKPYELGSEFLDIIRQALENNRRKRDTVSLRALLPVFDLANTSLLDLTPAAAEKRVVQAMQDALQAQHAGMYVRGSRRQAYRPIRVSGRLPEPGDDFWSLPEISGGIEPGAVQHVLFSRLQQADDRHVLERMNYACCLAASVQRQKESYLFLAAREQFDLEFQQSDILVFAQLAQQAAMLMENTRLFANLTQIARRIDSSTGLMQQSERMRQIESVVPAMLPDINNPVQSLKNSLVLAARPENQGSRAYSYLAMAQKELYRLEVALQRLLGMLQPPQAEPAHVEVESLIQQTVELLAARIKETGVQVKTSYGRPLLPVTAVRGQLEQVLLTLVENALDAMQSRAGEKLLWIDAACENGTLCISVEDSGPGIDAAARAQMFRPFFTTKPGGSGVGLAAAQRILRDHGGDLVLASSRHGGGAHLQVRLPC